MIDGDDADIQNRGIIGNQKNRIAKIKKAEQVMAAQNIENNLRTEQVFEKQRVSNSLNTTSPSSPPISPRHGLTGQAPLKKNYILVLDLDETLVHFKDSRYLTDD